jgi:hypothetical protein
MAVLKGVFSVKLSLQRFLFWTPRGLGLLFAGFLSLFALDVFSAGYGVWESVAALLIHLIPTAVLLVVLVLSWRWPWVGAVGFIGFAAWYLATFWERSLASVELALAGLPLGLGLLFLVDWRYGGALRMRPTPTHPR